MSLKETCLEIKLREKTFTLIPEMKELTETLGSLIISLNCINISEVECKIIFVKLCDIYQLSQDDLFFKRFSTQVRDIITYYRLENLHEDLYYLIDIMIHIIGTTSDQNVFFPYDFFVNFFSTVNIDNYVTQENKKAFLENKELFIKKLNKLKQKHKLMTTNIQDLRFTIH